MNDKQIIETLRGIKAHCATGDYFDLCQRCRFHLKNKIHYCQLMWLLGAMANEPKKWNMEKIERIINETD